MSEEGVKCSYCPAVLKKRGYLLKHIQYKHSSTDVNKWKCNICGKNFSQQGALITHTKIHTGFKVECTDCDKKFRNNGDMKDHYARHHDLNPVKKHECSHCDKKFIKKGELTSHTRSHTGEKPFKCNNCELSFSGASNLRTHEIAYCVASTKELQFTCHLCPSKFNAKIKLQTHINNHKAQKSHICNICNFSTKLKHNLDKHLKAVHLKDTQFDCPSCGKVFYDQYDMKKHRLAYCNNINRDFDFTCDKCQRKFDAKIKLQKHMHIAHPSLSKVYKCNLCEMTFNRDPLLRAHRKNIHETCSRKRHTCLNCHKDFSSSTNLKIHIKYHDNVKVQCPKCDNVYSERSMKEHLLRKHSLDFEKKHICQLCGKKFITNQEFVTHTRTHSGEKPYTCDVCDHRFSTSSNLRKHESVHGKPDSIICKICGKSISSKKYLVKHIEQTHSSKSVSCSICSQKFKYDLLLRRHTKRKHNNKTKT